MITEARPELRLATFTGVGEFGASVVDRYTELSEIVPEHARRCVEAGTVAAWQEIGERLQGARQALTSLERMTVGATGDAEVLGFDAGLLPVHHFVICSFEDLPPPDHRRVAPAAVDLTTWMIWCDQTPLPQLHVQLHDAVVLLTGRNSHGQSVSRALATDAAAGLLIAAALPGGPDALHEPRGRRCAGFSGMYGLVADSRAHLVALVAADLLERHVSPHPVIREAEHVPPPVDAAIHRFGTKSLASAILDPSTVASRIPVAIPVLMEWTGSSATLRLDRAAVALALPDDPAEWAQALESYSRTFDVTTATAWEARVDHAAGELCAGVAAGWPSCFEEILTSVPYGLFFARYALQQLGAASGDVSIEVPGTGADVQSAVSAVARHGAAQPNPPLLALRAALVFVPALLTIPTLVWKIYGGWRGPLFAAVSALLLGAAGAYAFARRVRDARRGLILARDAAVDAIRRRQEAALTQRVRGALSRVRQARADACSRVEARCLEHQQRLEEAREQLQKGSMEPPTGTALLRPRLRTVDEYRRLVTRLGPELTDAYSRACEARVFPATAPGGSEPGSSDHLVRFCTDFIRGHSRDIEASGALPDWPDLATEARTADPLGPVPRESIRQVAIVPAGFNRLPDHLSEVVPVETSLMAVVSIGSLRQGVL